MERKRFIYKFEAYNDVFSAVFFDLDSRVYLSFEISNRRNMSKKLKRFLLSGIQLVGFNNLNFEYPIIHEMLTSRHEEFSSEWIRVKVKDAIAKRITYKSHIVPQLDLYQMNGYYTLKNPLKSLQLAMNWEWVSDLPFKEDWLVVAGKMGQVIDYCRDTVDFIYLLYQNSLETIGFRGEMEETTPLKVMNWSDMMIGERLNVMNFQRLSGKQYKDFKSLRTTADRFDMSSIISPSIVFKTEQLKQFLDELKLLEFDNNQTVSIPIVMGKLHLRFSKGGLRSEETSGIVNNERGFLEERDVFSMHGSTIVNEGLFPRHLGPKWTEMVSEMLELRFKSEGMEKAFYKKQLNACTYGKLGDSDSWQFDEITKYRTTINGELKMLMLIEELQAAKAEVISVNTDGLVIHYGLWEKKAVDEVFERWTSTHGYRMSIDSYKKIWQLNINNYMVELKDGGFLKKGIFSTDRGIDKDGSKKIVGIALFNYFVKGVNTIDTISNHKNIYDFCIGRKSEGRKFHILEGSESKELKHSVIRYFISKKGCKLFEEINDVLQIEKGYEVSMLMDVKKEDSYDVNYNYYVSQCANVINVVSAKKEENDYKQEKLF